MHLPALWALVVPLERGATAPVSERGVLRLAVLGSTVDAQEEASTHRPVSPAPHLTTGGFGVSIITVTPWGATCTAPALPPLSS